MREDRGKNDHRKKFNRENVFLGRSVGKITSGKSFDLRKHF